MSKKKFEPFIFNPIHLDDYMKSNLHRFSEKMSKAEFKIIFAKLIFENFGPLQTKYIITKKTLIKEDTLETYNHTIQNINEKQMYKMSALVDLLSNAHYFKYIRGAYGFYNKKPS